MQAYQTSKKILIYLKVALRLHPLCGSIINFLHYKKTEMFENKIFTLIQKTLDFRSQRQDLLASNIANKDTPGFKAEDLVFEKSLENALFSEEPGPLKTTNLKHFDGRNTPPLELVKAQRINSAAPFPDFDGNTVDLDREMAKMAENQLMYNASIRMLTHQFRMLKTAITEGR